MATLQSGRKTVTTGGTAVQLATSTSVNAVMVQALSTNTNPVVVGGSDVVAAVGTRKGIYLNAGDALSVDTDDLADVWIDCVTNGEGVLYMAVTEA